MLQKIITILFLSGDTVSFTYLSKLTGASPEEIEHLLPELRQSLSGIGLLLLEEKNGISIVTDRTQAELVQAFWKEELQGDLTPASLQVLTLVAYMGSPTREEISYIRGVQSTQSIRSLSVRGLIRREGEMCMVTGDALKQLGVTKVEDLSEYETIHAGFIEKLKVREGGI